MMFIKKYLTVLKHQLAKTFLLRFLQYTKAAGVAVFIPKSPISRKFGFDRGTPIDRYYIERFLSQHSADIKADVLEIAEDTYSRKFGGTNISNMHILHVENTLGATLVGDLQTGFGIPADAFDCIVLTQTLPFIYDFKSAIMNSFQALRREGVVLATVPCICQISRYDMDRWGDYWRFTDLSALKIFEDVFGRGNVEVNVFGNYYAAVCFLSGLSVEDINSKYLTPFDSDYQMIIGIKAIKR